MVSLSPLLICAIEQATVERGVALCSLVASASRPLFSLIWRNHRRRYTPLLPVCRTGVRRFQETRASLKVTGICALFVLISGAPLSGDEGILLIWRNHRRRYTPLLPVCRTGVRRFQETRASLKGWVFREAPACHLPFQASGRPNSPFYPRGRRGSSQGWIFWQAPARHLPFQASGRPTPLLPLWEKRARGMRGNGARECSTSLISPKNSTLERKEDGG